MTHLQNVIIVSHTHWDREWYRTFQCFRFRLVDMMDRLLDFLLHHSGYAHFLLDGQSVLLEDYLALRPERAQDIRHLVEEGRLGIGPWYVQPDEFLSSGEALIRNLLLGHRVAQGLGGSIKVGWLPDTFGHIAQLPQILCGFEIDTFVTSRGLGDHLEKPALEFWWDAPNGSRVLALHQQEGYYSAGNLGYPCFWGDTRIREPDPALAVAKVRELVTQLRPHAASPTIAIWNGADHMPAQETLLDMIVYLNQELEDYTVRHARVEEYAAVVRRADSALPVIHGELRGSRYQNLHATVLSSRMHLKQANYQTQQLLEHYAEPLAAAAWLAGDRYPHAQLQEAWRLTLRNHAHDSICGCSIDQAHREMAPRFEQAQQIAECVVTSALKALSRQVDTSWCCPDSVGLLVFNPLPRERREVVEVALRLPRQQQVYQATDHEGMSTQVEVVSERLEAYPWLDRTVTVRDLPSQVPFWRECVRELDGLDVAGFEFETEDGIATLRLHLSEWPLGSDRVAEQLQSEAVRWSVDTEIKVEASYVLVNLALLAELPPCGYATYAIGTTDTPAEHHPCVHGDARSLENQHLRIEVGPHGRFTLTDKETQRHFGEMHQFEDVGDRGDCYDFCPLSDSDSGNDILMDQPDVEMRDATGLVRSIAIRHQFQVPFSLAENRRRRSARRVEMPVTTVLKLKAGTRYLEILTQLDNQACDHRLRALFPTGIDSDEVHADGHFAVATRKAMPAPTEGWHQPPSAAQPHHTWFGTDHGENGLAILSEGLPEHAGLPDEGMTLALTLLRSVGWLSRGDLSTRQGHSGPAVQTPDAQCLGHYNLRYGLLPYQGDPISAEVHLSASAFDVPPIARCVAIQRGKLPPRQSIVSLQPHSLVLSALKRSERDNRLLMRFYNVSQSPVEADIRFGFQVTEVYRATAGETILEPLELSPDGFHCRIEVDPAEIITLLLRPKEPNGLFEP